MFRKILEVNQSGRTCVLVTVTNTKGSTPREIGAKMLVTESEFFGSIGGGTLEWIALEKARELLREDKDRKMSVPLCSKAHQCCGGFVELFFDVLRPKAQLLIFGAGHVAQALLEVMAGTSFDCHVIDEREEWIEAARQKAKAFSNLSIEAHLRNPISWIDQFKHWSLDNTFCVVMTHEHSLDEDIVFQLAQKPFKYLGLIGSQTKKQRFLARLGQRGLTQEQLQKITCPMGLPIGGKTPKEVALSIAAELVQISHQSSLETSL